MTFNVAVAAQPVVRDRLGAWTHPDFFFPEEWQGHRAPPEFAAWLDANRLTSALGWMENETTPDVITEWERTGCFARWIPAVPPGEGWFPVSIHDGEDGPLCVWLRPRQGSAAT